MTISEVGCIGIYIHIGYNFIKVEYSRRNRLGLFIAKIGVVRPLHSISKTRFKMAATLK